jgi:hypothetical protein
MRPYKPVHQNHWRHVAQMKNSVLFFMKRYSVQLSTAMLKKLPVIFSILVTCIIQLHVNGQPDVFGHRKNYFVKAGLGVPFFYSITGTNNATHTATLKGISNIHNPHSTVSTTFGLASDFPIKVPYFGSAVDDSLFLCRYEQGDTLMVENAVIDVLDLKKFAVYDNDKKKFVINKTIILKSCIINKLEWGDPGTLLSRDSNFIMQKPLIIDGCSFNDFIIKPGLIFNSIFSIANSAGIKINFQDCRFNDQVIVYQNDMKQLYDFPFGDQDTADYHAFLDTMNVLFARNIEDSSYLAFSNCNFMKLVIITNFLNQNSVYLNAGCSFNAACGFGHVHKQDVHGENIFKDTCLKIAIAEHIDSGVVRSTAKNIRAQKSKFFGPVVFTNNLYEKTNFSSCDFYDTVSLRDVSFTDSLVFNDIFVKKGVMVYINPSQVNNILKYTIQASTFEKIYLPYSPYNIKDSCDQRTLENGIDYYDKLIEVLGQEFKDEAFNRLQNKYEHDKAMFRLEYYNINKFGSIGNFFTFLWLNILEATVGNGYKGGCRFICSLLLVTLVFCLIYFIYFHKQALYFVRSIYDDGQKQNENVTHENKRENRSFLSFAECFWISLIILLSPKFPYSYFKGRGSLFYFLVVEWILGLLLVSLFLVYIASTYSFVRAIVGF